MTDTELLTAMVTLDRAFGAEWQAQLKHIVLVLQSKEQCPVYVLMKLVEASASEPPSADMCIAHAVQAFKAQCRPEEVASMSEAAGRGLLYYAQLTAYAECATKYANALRTLSR